MQFLLEFIYSSNLSSSPLILKIDRFSFFPSSLYSSVTSFFYILVPFPFEMKNLTLFLLLQSYYYVILIVTTSATTLLVPTSTNFSTCSTKCYHLLDYHYTVAFPSFFWDHWQMGKAANERVGGKSGLILLKWSP